MSGGRDGMLGVVVSEMGLGSGRTKRGGWWVVDVVEVWNCGAGTGSEGSSSSNVGWRGVVGGEVGDGEYEDMIIASASASASGGLGRRRLDVGWVDSAKCDAPLSCNGSSSSRPELVSSISSLFLTGNAGGRWGRLERGEENCVAGVAFSFAVFWVELKLNRGTEANCWEEDDCVAFCWKRRDELGLGVASAGLDLDLRKRWGEGVCVSY